MPSKNKLCQNWKLYVITDRSAVPASQLQEVVAQALEGGAHAIQLRDKIVSDEELIAQARQLLLVTRRYQVPLIINDRLAVAQKVSADGVHLGQEDASFVQARQLLGDKILLGRSTHSPEQALRAQKEGFDYVGVGPVFATPTKPTYQPVGLELVRWASENLQIPFVAIGGIDEGNVSQVYQVGAKTVAVVRAVMASKNPKQSAKNLNEAMRFDEKK